MSDKEILIQSIHKIADSLASKLFNLNSVGSKAILTYILNNLEDKYSTYLDLFVNKEGNINMELLCNSFKDEIKSRNGIVISVLGKHIKFNDDDVDELLKTFNQFKLNVK